MANLDDNSVIVSDYAQLAAALSQNNGITHVYLRNDITLQAGISIYAQKSTLVIDGIDPEDETGTIHSITDIGSSSLLDTIGIHAASSLNLTLQNLKIHGNNYYGVPYVLDNTSTSDVFVTYDKVTYRGPQMTFNPYGFTKYKDCDITIVSTYAAANEVGEVSKVEFDGITTIEHHSADDAVFWFRGNANAPYLQVLPGAKVDITTTNYFMFNLLPVILVQRPVKYIIGTGASFTLNAAKAFADSSYHRVASFLLEENASFSYTQGEDKLNTAMLYVNETFTIKEGASFYMEANYVNTAALIQFMSGSTALNIENPKQFVLYAKGHAALAFNTNLYFTLIGNQLNYWETARPIPIAGTIDDEPLHQWRKLDENSFRIYGLVGPSTMIIQEEDFTEEEKEANPDLELLSLPNARVLSLGHLPLTLNKVADDHRPITGTTTAGALVTARYNLAGEDIEITDTAYENGSFSLSTDEPLPLGTVVAVLTNIPFLIAKITTTSVEPDEIIIAAATTSINFVLSFISQDPPLFDRNPQDITITIDDSRLEKTSWEILLSLESPFATEEGHVLTDVIVFRDVNMVTLTTEPTRIYQGETTERVTTITWPIGKGVLLLGTKPLYMGEEYRSRLKWEVRPI